MQDVLNPAGPAARTLASAGWFVLVVFVAVSVMMWLLIAWLAVRRRGTLTEHQPWDAPSDPRWIAIGGLAVPIATLFVVFIVSLKTMAAFPMEGSESRTAPIHVIGHQWWWEVHYVRGGVDDYVTTANEIHIPAGVPVDIDLESRDVIHSFWIPRLHGKVDLVPGQANQIRIQADEPGEYQGEWAEYCGAEHARMRLLVTAQPPADFEAWLVHERAPSAQPADAERLEGRALFMSRECVLCHTIRGTDAHGLVGPDLTHVGARRRIPANMFPNELSYVEAWIAHAQSLKPNAQMPNVNAFTGDQLHALAEYLEDLK